MSASRIFNREIDPYLAFKALAAGVIWVALKEALKHPKERRRTFETWYDFVMMVLQMLGDLLLTPYYIFRSPEKPELYMNKRKASKKLKAAIAAAVSLKSFKASPYTYAGSLISFLIQGVRERTTMARYHSSIYKSERELLKCEDGGQIALDWIEREARSRAGLKDGEAFPKSDTTPIFFVVTTLAGGTYACPVIRGMYKFSQNGWRAVAYIKRGCGQRAAVEQTGPVGWHLGGQEDLKLAVESVRTRWPNAPIYATGYSVGGMQLRTFAVRSGEKCPFRGMVDECSPNWAKECCEGLDRRVPLVGKILGTLAVKGYRKYGEGCGKKEIQARLEQCPAPCSMCDSIRYILAPSNGLTFEQWWEESQPPQNIERIGRPYLSLNTWTDLCFEPADMESKLDWHKRNPNMATCFNSSGSHVVRWEGWSGRCWVAAVTYEFLSSLYQQDKDAGLFGAGLAKAQPTSG